MTARTTRPSALQEEGRGDDEPLLVRRGQRIRPGRGARRGAGRAPLRAALDRPRRCAGCRARRPRACRGGAAIGACARGAARLPISRRTLRDSVRNDGEVLRLGRLKRRPAPAQDPAADRRLRLDEGAAPKTTCSSRMRWRRRAECRGLHLRHAADPRHPRVAAQAPRAGARRGRAISSATGTAAPASATRCRRFSPCRASPATRAAPPCVVLSDGLERGDPAALRDAVAKLSRRAWRVSWLTPLAAGPGFTPADRSADRDPAASSTISSTADRARRSVAHVLALGRRRAA